MFVKLEKWKEDEMLNQYREAYLESNTIPTIDEIEEALKFFALWSVGCSTLRLNDLAEKFTQRFNTYILGAIEMGYHNTMYYRAGVTVYSSLARVIASVSYHVEPEY